jgi:hypothetical protein
MGGNLLDASLKVQIQPQFCALRDQRRDRLGGPRATLVGLGRQAASRSDQLMMDDLIRRLIYMRK